ncbi:hypothetical protein [Streptomyces sp. NPDC002845]
MAIKRCRSSFAATVGGVPRVMRAGALVNDDDPVLKGREHLFEDVETYVQDRTRVEEATAEPGARRSLTRTVKRTPKGKPAAKTSAGKPPTQKTERAPGGQGQDGQSGPQTTEPGSTEGTGAA